MTPPTQFDSVQCETVRKGLERDASNQPGQLSKLVGGVMTPPYRRLSFHDHLPQTVPHHFLGGGVGVHALQGLGDLGGGVAQLL